MRRLQAALALLVVPLLALAQTAPVASLDRTHVAAGDTVTLNIELAGEPVDEPDFSPLMTDFVVLGTSTNHTLSIINGTREAHTMLGIALRPRREGHLTVPSLTIDGQKTQPVAVDVAASQDAGGAPGTPADRPVMLEGKIDPASAYVGQQVDYTLRLMFAVNLADGQLGDPAADGAEVRRIGQDANYQTVRGGRRFNVVERHYAIFPQRAGTLDIKPPTFQGTAVDPMDSGAFFGGGSPVNAVAERVRLTVRNRPSTAASGAWIPARALTLAIDGVPTDDRARVGQPMTLTMRLDATGMPFEALPALSLPTIDGADVYPDKAVTGGGVSGPWITGRRQQGFAVVPNRPGKLHIPATTLHWWNVVSDKEEVATLPDRYIDVLPGANAPAATGGGPAVASTAAPSGQAGPAAEGSAAASASTAGSASASSLLASTPWRWLFAAVLALWVITVLAWFVISRRRRTRTAASAGPAAAAALGSGKGGPGAVAVASGRRSSRKAHEDFLKAAEGADAILIEQALLAWSRAERPATRSLGDLTTALEEGTQREAIARLQRARFAGVALEPGVLRGPFASGLAWRRPDAPSRGDGLPPLYPR